MTDTAVSGELQPAFLHGSVGVMDVTLVFLYVPCLELRLRAH